MATSRVGFSSDKASESSGTTPQTSAPYMVSTSSDKNVDVVNRASTQLSTLNLGQLALRPGLEGDEAWVQLVWSSEIEVTRAHFGKC